MSLVTSSAEHRSQSARCAGNGREGDSLLRISGATKRFPGVVALADVSFDLREGEVLGIVGENGAGKSTLIKALTGAHRLDSGSIAIDGAPLSGDVRAHRAAGVAAIYQELGVVPELNAVQNVFLDAPPRRGPFVRRGEADRRFRALAEQVGAEIAPRAPARRLSVADQQLLEIMRALAADRRVLIMDEPTAALGAHERERLRTAIGALRNERRGIIFISHDLDEVLEICDRVLVMRQGAVVASEPATSWTRGGLVGAMLGAAAQELLRIEHPPVGGLRAHAEDIVVPGRVHGVSLRVARGEILGLAGLVGSGRTEILRAIAGTEPGATGTLTLDGERRPLPRTVREAIRRGIGMTPEDRKQQGLVLGRPAALNVALPWLRESARRGWLSPTAVRENVTAGTKAVAFDPTRLSTSAGLLSGGNQQKLLLARWLHDGTRLLLLDEPTRGVDVGARVDIYEAVRRMAQSGTAVIVVSSEIEEVVDISHRVAVIAAGRVLTEMAGSEASVERVLRCIFVAEREEAAV